VTRLLNNRTSDLYQRLRASLPTRSLLVNKVAHAEVYIYADIGDMFVGGIGAKDVVDALGQAKGKPLDIHIMSDGGDIFTAKAIYAALKGYRGPKTVYVDGLAASAATYIMLAGDRILAAPGSTFITHAVWTVAKGNATELRKIADDAEMETKAMSSVYAARMGTSADEAMQFLSEERRFDSKRAIELRLINAEYDYPDLQNKTTSVLAAKGNLANQVELMRLRTANQKSGHTRLFSPTGH